MSIPEANPPADENQATPPETTIQPPKPGFLHRMLHYLFDPETRFGRSLRGIVRGLALIVGIFALGLLTDYLLLYRPAAQSLQAARTEIQTLQEDLTQTQKDLDIALSDTEILKTRVQEAQEVIDRQTFELEIAALLNQAQTARYTLASNSSQSAIKADLDKISSLLEDLIPKIEKQDGDLAKNLDARLKLISSEQARDPETALDDLGLFITSLDKFVP